MQKRRFVLVAYTLAFGTVLLVAPSARAQQGAAPYIETKTDSGQAVVFPDDLASGDGPKPWGDVIRPPPGAARMGLVRPRFNFVTEMLKSVEDM